MTGRYARIAALLGLAALLCAAAFASLAGASGGSHRTILVSRAGGTHGASANDASTDASVSADGRFLAFTSLADNLSSADSNHLVDVYVRDLQRHRTILVSRATGTHGDIGNGHSQSPAISADGRFVAFQSDATNLSSADSSGDVDVYVRDLKKHRTILVSRRNGTHGAKGSFNSSTPSISANGRAVAFYSQATNLSSADSSLDYDVYVRQLNTHRTILATRRNGAHGAKANDSTYDPSISADGHAVAFYTYANNLSSADPNSGPDVYVRQLNRHRTILVSRRSGKHGAVGLGDSYDASISADGSSVAFDSNADNLSSAHTNGSYDTYVRRLNSHRTIFASRRNGTHGADANSESDYPSLSANGRVVAFQSSATNLSSADSSSGSDIYVRNLGTHRTILASRRNGTHGAKANDDSSEVSISADGHSVAFESLATNLSSADSDSFYDVYLRTGPF